MPRYELNLQDYWRIIRKRRWIIIVILLVVCVPTFIYTKFQSRAYQAEAQISVTERKTGGDWLRETFYYQPGDPMKSYEEAIASQGVTVRAAVRLNLLPVDIIDQERIGEPVATIIQSIRATLSTKVKEGTNKISIYSTSIGPVTACLYANAIAHSFVDYNLAEKTKQERKARDFIKTQLDDTEQRLNESERALQKLREKHGVSDIAAAPYNQVEDLEKTKQDLLKKYTSKHPDIVALDKQILTLRQKLMTYSEDEISFARLKRDVMVYTTLYNNLKSQYTNAASEAEKAPDVSVVNEANTASEIAGKKTIGLIAGIIIGLILGLALAFMMEHLDTSLGTIEEIENLLKIPVLGVIPHLSPEEPKSSAFLGLFKKKEEKSGVYSPGETLRSQLILNYSPLSPITESYRILRTNIMKNNLPAEGGKIIIITSTGPDEGKTLTSINLAIAMAEKGEKVLLIDTDIRKAMIHNVFGVNREPGLSELLVGTNELPQTVRDITDTLMGGIPYEVITRTPGIDNLHIVTAGSNLLHPVELISSGKIDTLFKELRMQYDYILLDCAPILPVTDALILGPKSDITIMVYRAGKTAKNALVRAVDQLRQANVPIKGIVLNYITPEIEVSPTYYHQYYRYYPSDKKDKPA